MLVIEPTQQGVKLAFFSAYGSTGYSEGLGATHVKSISVAPVDAAQAVVHFLMESLKVAEKEANRRLDRVKLIVGISQHVAITRFFSLPSLNREEIRQMACLQMLKEIPFSEDEVIMDAVPLTQSKGGSHVLVIAVEKKKLEAHSIIMEKLGRLPDAFALSSCSLGEVIAQTLGSPITYAVLYHHEGWLEFDIYQHSKLKYCRSIPLKGNEKIDQEYQSTLKFAGLEEKEIQKLVVIGVAPNKLFDALKIKVPVVTLADFPSFPIHELQDDFVTLLGARLTPSELYFDLLPQGERVRRDTQKLMRRVRQVGLYAALWLISVVGVYGVGVMQKIFALSSVNRQLALVEKDAKQVQGVLKRTNFLRDELEAGDIPLDILKALHEAIPGDTYLLALNYDRQGILVQGTTGALGSVTDFMDRLEKTKVFSKVQLKTYSVRNVQGKQWVDFYIQSQPRIEMHSNEKVS